VPHVVAPSRFWFLPDDHRTSASLSRVGIRSALLLSKRSEDCTPPGGLLCKIALRCMLVQSTHRSSRADRPSLVSGCRSGFADGGPPASELMRYRCCQTRPVRRKRPEADRPIRGRARLDFQGVRHSGARQLFLERGVVLKCAGQARPAYCPLS
jgi:hypothetical protein